MTPLIKRRDEHIAALKLFQHVFAVVISCERVTQRTVQAVEDGGFKQKGTFMFGLALQDFLKQVVQDKAVAAAKGFDEAPGVCMPPHRYRRKLQSGYPALGTVCQRSDISVRNIQANHTIEEFTCLRGGKAQIIGAQLAQLAPGTHPCQRKRRILTGDYQQVHLLRQMLQHE
ncbi:MAG: hypothetical protein AB9880_12110 [Christensenellales bacterium]